jgi:hypothetical protein
MSFCMAANRIRQMAGAMWVTLPGSNDLVVVDPGSQQVGDPLDVRLEPDTQPLSREDRDLARTPFHPI